MIGLVQAPSHSRLPRPLSLFLLILAALALLSILDAALNSLHAGHPVLGDLWIPYPGFDFYDYTPRFPLLHTHRFFTEGVTFPWIYPAPAIFLLYPFYLFSTPMRWHLGYSLFALLGLALCVACATRFGSALKRRGLTRQQIALLLGTTALLGWPIYFVLQRGNIELYLWVGIAAAVALIANRRFTAGALVLGVVGSVKTYPLLLVGLLLLQRRFRESALALGVAALTTLLALRTLEPNVAEAWRSIRTGVAQWTEITTSQYPPTGLGPDHSLLGLLRQCSAGAILRPAHTLPVYLAAVGVITTVVFFLRVRHLPVPNQTLFIVCAAILLPPTSYDYTLLLLFIPWGWMALICAERPHALPDSNRLKLLFAFFAVALAPLTFLHSRGALVVRFEGPARCVALLALITFAAAVPVSPAASTPAEAL